MRVSLTVANLLVALSAAMMVPAAGAAYPDKPVQVIVPYPPGGVTDVFARSISQKLSVRLGQPFVIQSKPGAGGTIGSNLVAKAKPDGYTIMFGSFGTHTINDALMKLPYDPLKDFAPITSVAATPLALLVQGSSSIKSLKDVVEQSRAKPGSLSHANSGIGNSPQLAVELFKQKADVDITDVTFSGGAPAMVAVLGGQVTMLFNTIGTAMEQIKAGNLRPLAVSSPLRSALLPDVPTIAESGYPGFDVIPWFAFWAPAGTPPDVVEKLNREINAILQSPEMKKEFMEAGADAMGGTVDEFVAYQKAEHARWVKFVKDTGIKAPN